MTNVFAQHWRLGALVLGIAVFIWVVYLIRSFLLPFAIGLVLAYLLMPVVFWLEKRLPPRHKWQGFKRVLAVILVFILLLCIVGGFLYIMVSAIIDATVVLVENTPFFINDIVQRLQGWLDGVISTLPPDMQAEVRETLTGAVTSIGGAIRDALMVSARAIPAAFDVILGFLVLPFFLFYLLKDHEKLIGELRSALPENVARHGRNVINIIEQVLGRYLKSQLVLGFVVAYFVFVGLTILRVPYALPLAMLAGIGELIPTLGPWIAGVVAVVVTLAMAPGKTIWVAVVFLGVQVLENSLLVPKIQGVYLRIHPAIMIVLLVFGAYVAGIWGIIFIGPLTATLIAIYKYIRGCYTCRDALHIPNL